MNSGAGVGDYFEIAIINDSNLLNLLLRFSNKILNILKLFLLSPSTAKVKWSEGVKE